MHCPSCGQQNEGAAQFCGSCGTQLPPTAEIVRTRSGIELSQPDQRVRGLAASRPRSAELQGTGKRPALAAVLSLITGVGQFYNRDYLKGLLFLAAAIIANTVFRLPILSLAIGIWSMVDAYQVAKGKWAPMGRRHASWSARG